jgi:hypothetical protein
MLESTADAAALATVIELPDSGAAIASAVACSSRNMPVELHGEEPRESSVAGVGIPGRDEGMAPMAPHKGAPANQTEAIEHPPWLSNLIIATQ